MKVINKRGCICSLLVFLVLLALSSPAGNAQPYQIDWYTIDGGGGTSSGGPYTFTGTIGQPDAGVGMSGGSYELLGGFWPGGQIADCFPSTYTTYYEWVALGKPACWCAPPYGSGYQCDGDVDGRTEGPEQYRVSLNDVGLIIDNWRKTIDDLTLNPCADIDHKAEGSLEYRVFTGDLNILITNWKKTEAELLGDCPRPE